MEFDTIYNKLKMLKHLKIQSALQNNVMPPLTHVMVYLTNKCNFNCIFCSFREGNGYPVTFDNTCELSGEFLEGLVESFTTLGVKAVTVVGGGEPTLHKSCGWFLSELGSRGIYTGLTTNGIRLEEVFKNPIDNVAWIRVSINGTNAETYATVHRTQKDKFFSVMRQLRVVCGKVVQNGTRVGVNCIVCGDNYLYARDFVKELEYIGVQHVRFTVATGLGDVLYNEQDLIKAETILLGVQEEFKNSNINVFVSLRDRNESIIHNIQDYPYCYIKDVSTCIGADKVLYPCCVKINVGTHAWGVIPDDGNIVDIWEGLGCISKRKTFSPATECQHHCMFYGLNKNIKYLYNEKITKDDFFV